MMCWMDIGVPLGSWGSNCNLFLIIEITGSTGTDVKTKSLDILRGHTFYLF